MGKLGYLTMRYATVPIAALLFVTGCTVDIPDSSDANPIPTTFEEALASPDYAPVPGGLLMHKSCVHAVPDNAYIDIDGSVWVGGELVDDEYVGGQLVDAPEPCPYPSFAAPNSPFSSGGAITPSPVSPDAIHSFDPQEPNEHGDTCRIVTNADGVRTVQCTLAQQDSQACGNSRDNPCIAAPPAEVCGTSRQNPCRVNHN